MARHRLIPWLATALVGTSGSPAFADTINIGTRTEHRSTFTGTRDVHAINPGAISGVTLTTAPAASDLAGGTGYNNYDVAAQPFGDFDSAGGVVGNFPFARTPKDSATFVFAGSDAVGFYPDDSVLSETVEMLGKWATRKNPSGRKAPGQSGQLTEPPVVEVTPIPAPPALMLGLVGVAGLAAAKRSWVRRTPKMA